MNLTVCLGYRNWILDHLQRCLRSLARFVPCPVIVVDLGSDDGGAGVAHVASAFPAVRVLVRQHLEWNRSVALNAAADAATTSHVAFTDADMIFPNDWALEVLSAIESQEAPFTVWLTRSRDLVPGDLPDPATDEWLGAHSFPHSHAGQGGGMVVPRAWWQGVGGFDECYRVWGAEDNDLVLRALWSGLDVRWLPTTSVYHQWHSRLGTAEQLDHLQRNRRYLADRVAQCGPVYRPRVVRVDT